MKILHILATPRAEGTPNLVLDWLATGKHEQEVFVLHSDPADLTERLREGSRWYAEKDYFSRGRRKFTDITRDTYRVCRERKPDLVICWVTGFAHWACLGARLAGIKSLLVHGGNPPKRGFREDWMSRVGLWPLVAVGAKCVCCSDYVRDRYREIPMIPARLFETVWNCVRADAVRGLADLARTTRTESDRVPTAIMVATLEAHKDHATLFRAVPKIREALPEFRLLLAGEGSLRKELEALVADLGIANTVEFLGMRRDVPELLGQADLFVFSTTTQEGLGSVLLEAMAAGLPIVASDVPACREALEDGTYGHLVPPADPHALAEALVKALRHGAKEAELAPAYGFACSFTSERMMAQYLAMYGHPLEL